MSVREFNRNKNVFSVTADNPTEENITTMPDQSPIPATTSGPSSAVGQQQSLHVPSVHRSKRVSLRRTTIRKAGNFQLNGTFQFTHTFPDVGIHLFIDVDINGLSCNAVCCCSV